MSCGLVPGNILTTSFAASRADTKIALHAGLIALMLQ